jgi:threonyl-tRNA synthetase
MAPVQVRVLPISDRHLEYAREVEAKLGEVGIRVHVDDRSEKLGFKIREAEVQKIPLMLVAGDKELESRSVTPRWRDESKTSGEAVALDTLVSELEIENKTRRARSAS